MTQSLFRILFALALTSSFVSIADANCGGDDTKNSFIMGATDINSMTVSLAGTGPDTAANEIIGYMKTAGAEAGVIETKTLSNGFGRTSYKAGNISAYIATQGNICPPIHVQVTKSTSLWPQWSAAAITIKAKSVVRLIPSSEDALTLAQLMKASGVPTKPVGDLEKGLFYQGKNINCETSEETGKLTASCSILVDIAN